MVFDISINYNTDTKYQEIFAWCILVNIGFFNIPFSEDYLVGEPDLQVGNVGFEVTQAVFSKHNTVGDSMLNKIGHLPANEKRFFLDKHDKKGLHKNYDVDDGAYTLESVPKKGQKESIIAAINKKVALFESYKKFATMGLFINAESSMNKFSDVLTEFSEANTKYDILVIKTTDLIYKFENNAWTKHNAIENCSSVIQQARDLRSQLRHI